jgi:hypothetical protein
MLMFRATLPHRINAQELGNGMWDYRVRLNSANHQWGKDPPKEVCWLTLVACERPSWETGQGEASR